MPTWDEMYKRLKRKTLVRDSEEWVGGGKQRAIGLLCRSGPCLSSKEGSKLLVLSKFNQANGRPLRWSLVRSPASPRKGSALESLLLLVTGWDLPQENVALVNTVMDFRAQQGGSHWSTVLPAVEDLRGTWSRCIVFQTFLKRPL